MGLKFNPLTGELDLTGSSGGNSFVTIQTPSGTSPVADSTSDTLTLTSSNGSVTITGNATTDTIDLTSSSSDPTKMPLVGGVFTTNAPVAYQLNGSPFYFLTKTEVASNVLTIGSSTDASSFSGRHMSFNANGALSLGNIFAAQVTLSPSIGQFKSHFYDFTATTGTSSLGTTSAYWINCVREKDYIKSQSNGSIGQATLVGGTVTVNNTSVTANSRIFLSVSTAGGTQGFLSYTKSAGASFTINSTSATETSVVDWYIVESF